MVKLTLEHFSDPLSSQLKFLLRFARNFLAAIAVIVVSLLLGMMGYRHYGKMSWSDAYLNASMILSGMGPVGEMQSDAGKIFAGTYALYSGFIVILASGIVLTPLIHRLLHRFHLSDEHRKKSNKVPHPKQDIIP